MYVSLIRYYMNHRSVMDQSSNIVSQENDSKSSLASTDPIVR